jgi:anaerobic glycerol-3-phosphate dehydrogenase
MVENKYLCKAAITNNVDSMATHKKINISIHQIELNKLDRLKQKFNETRSGMITRLIQEHEE